MEYGKLIYDNGSNRLDVLLDNGSLLEDFIAETALTYCGTMSGFQREWNMTRTGTYLDYIQADKYLSDSKCAFACRS